MAGLEPATGTTIIKDHTVLLCHLSYFPGHSGAFGDAGASNVCALRLLGSLAEGSPSLGSNPLYLLRGIC